jgi:hypothetical protein
MVTTGLYGDPTSYFTDGVHPTRANQIIFNLCLLLVQIILLNLVIAVMGATYERVASQTIRQSLYERAAIIVEVEETWTPASVGGVFMRIEFGIRLFLLNVARVLQRCWGPPSSGEKSAIEDLRAATSFSAKNEKIIGDIERSVQALQLESSMARFPRWLQVLVPRSESHGVEDGDARAGREGDKEDSSPQWSSVNSSLRKQELQFKEFNHQLEELKDQLSDIRGLLSTSVR